MNRLTAGGLLGRFVASLVQVVATYNPTGFSFVSWLAGNFPHVQPIQAVVGLAYSEFGYSLSTRPGGRWEP